MNIKEFFKMVVAVTGGTMFFITALCLTSFFLDALLNILKNLSLEQFFKTVGYSLGLIASTCTIVNFFRQRKKEITDNN